MRTTLHFSILISVTGCNSVPIKVEDESIRATLAGAWGWTSTICKKSPQVYSFSDDGATMYVTSKEGLFLSQEGESHNSIKYQIIAESDRAIRTVIEGEERRTKKGNVVVWGLFLISSTRFCWHRTDWAEGSCKGP